MRISVFGLGYVGAVSAACLAAEGHEVIGVDKNPSKVDLFNSGRSPIIESGIDQLIASGHEAGRLRATTDAADAIRRSEISIVCVGTPSEANGSLNLSFVRSVCAEIGTALSDKGRPHDVVIRSTILPGAMRSLVIPTIEQSAGRKVGQGFRVCFNPEFLREGSAVHDFYHPAKTVVGESEPGAGDRLLELYGKLDAPVFRTSLETAEMVKYVDNTWHALKVGFANEIGSLAKALSIDSFEVMKIFCQDTKLNLSSYYLRPGFAFGGSCLPKDVRALRYRAKTLDVETPILNSILASNDAHIQRGLDLVMAQGKRRIGVLGFSFKAGTDDLRESPIVELIERLIGKGYELLVYDRSVNLARLTGANREYILNHVPHIGNLMRESIEEVLAHADVVIVGNSSPEFDELASRLRPEQRLIDLVRIEDARRAAARGANGQYHGICW
jgi:GDP-mannose 6-dehydrogenase